MNDQNKTKAQLGQRTNSVLVVDDEEPLRKTLSAALEQEGFSVLCAESGEQALERVEQQHVDLILLDILMPGFSGLDVLKELRKTYSAWELPVLMVTAVDESEDMIEALALGANDYIAKPFALPVLFARLRTSLSLSQAQRKTQEEITEHKQAEEALRESKEQFRSVAHSAVDAIIVADSRGNIISWNNAAQTSFGYEKQELLHKPLTILMPEEYRDAHKKGIERLTRGGQSNVIGTTIELQGLRKDGSEFPIELSLSSWRSQKGVFFGGVIRDITERRQAKEALQKAHDELEQRVHERTDKLQESEDRFQLAIRATTDGVWDWNILTNVEYFSPRWCEILGYSHDDPTLPHTYDSWAERIHPDDRDSVMNSVNAHLNEGKVYDVDYRHRHRSGEYRWQNSRGQAVFGEDGKPIRMTGCIRDITDRKRMEHELIRLERMKARSEMVQGVNHNLNNLLNGMLLPAQLLKDNLEDPQDRQRAELIEAAAQKAAQLVRRLNRAAKGEEEQPQSVAVSPQVLAAAESTRGRWQTEAEGRGIAIEPGDQPGRCVPYSWHPL